VYLPPSQIIEWTSASEIAFLYRKPPVSIKVHFIQLVDVDIYAQRSLDGVRLSSTFVYEWLVPLKYRFLARERLLLTGPEEFE
jgi:hypothetical protein